jgi:type IV fimbrial biogenesis protein FimT
MLTGRRPFTRRAWGFTVIELMVALTVLAIGTTLAAPSIASMVASRRVQSAGQSMLDGIQYARVEALRRNTGVRFSLRADGLGWTVTEVASNARLQGVVDPDWATVQVTSSNAATSVQFMPNGMRQTGSQIDQLTVTSAGSTTLSRRINVFGGGLIRMCDPGIATADDPRRC